MNVSIEIWDQIKQALVAHNLRPALLAVSMLCHGHIGGISAQDQMTSRWILLQLELFLDMEAQHRPESWFCFLLPLLTVVALLSSM